MHWNHRRETCNCGFGGEGYDPRKVILDDSISIHFDYQSFVNPRAKCPVCGDRVFFYRSPHGGAVYFDALGQPWPKHPCIVACLKVAPPRFPNPIGSQRNAWVNQGWSAIVLHAFRISEHPRRIVGYVQREWGGERWEAFHSNHEDFLWVKDWHAYPIFIKRLEDKNYRFITFTVRDGEFQEVEFLAERKS